MDIFEKIKQHWLGISLFFLIALIIIPFCLDKLFSTSSNIPWLAVHYEVGEVLSFYGTVLGGAIGGVAALLAVHFTVKYYEKKDKQLELNAIYEKQLSRIDKVIQGIYNRDTINYDFTLALGFSKNILAYIIEYNESLCRLKGFFTEYGMGVLNAFQREYDENLKNQKLSSVMFDQIANTEFYEQSQFRIDETADPDISDDYYRKHLSVIEFLNLKPELRQCAERIGHFGLYDNASDLIYSDPTLAYILEIEGGGSAGLWASLIHDQQGAFVENPDTFILWENFNKLIKKLLIELENYKNDEFKRIVINGSSSIVPKYCIKMSGSFMHKDISVVEYQISNSDS